jgi:hypothetical protein
MGRPTHQEDVMGLPKGRTAQERAMLAVRAARIEEMVSATSEFFMVDVGVNAEMLDNLMLAGVLRDRTNEEAVRGAVVRYLQLSLMHRIELAH